MQVLKTLYLAKQRRQFRGQKGGLCVSDDHLLYDCKRIIAEELAYVCGCAEAESSLNKRIEEKLKAVQVEK